MKKVFQKFINFANSWVGAIVLVLLFIFFVAQSFIIPSGSMLNTMLIGDALFVKKYVYGVPTPTIPWINLKILPDFNNNGHLIEGDKPKRGDIVIFNNPKAPNIHYVKRNVAIGGDELLYTKEGLWISYSEENPYSKVSNRSISYEGKEFYFDPYSFKHKGVHYENVALDAFRLLSDFSNGGGEIAMEKVRLDNGELAFYHKVKEGNFFMMGDNRNNSEDSRFWGEVEYRYIIGKPWFIFLSWDKDFNIRWYRIGKSYEALEEMEAK
ncbi:signal peptidase I [Helicobacter valdiviensis]|uniref:Signal peptidase I n=1 Tax=Helicobacter valdiviensis TaxID=1458358 RepID=A0A2W6MXI0_9HELI|nr:signal peptidase I [Helicobacter valdiviensis]PZT47898.1 signal peptidase I [Helicobacter valdiviensis]